MTKEGKILKALSGFYYVDCSGEVITCRARGNFRNENITPLVGDDVKIQISDNNTGYVVEILERKNELLRPKVANIDYSIIVVSVKDPEFSSKLLNKTICLNENSNVDIIIVFTKLDLLSDEELNKMKETGNENLMLTERGFSFGYNNLVVDMRSFPIMRSFDYPVIFDATHSVQLPGGAGTKSSGNREFVPNLARAAVASGVDGLFFEVHDNPEEALSDGPNMLYLDQFEAVLRDLVAIDKIVKG